MNEYRQDQTSFISSNKKMKDTVEDCVLRQNRVVNYMEKFVPIRTQLMLSESLYASLPRDALKKYIKVEEESMKILQSLSINLNNKTVDELQ